MKRRSYLTGKSINTLLLTGFSLLFIMAQSCRKDHQSDLSGGNINLAIDGRFLHVNAYIPEGVTEFELRIESDRNKKITRYTSISPHEKDSAGRAERYARSERETWYPVVDIVPDRGMEGVCIFKGEPTGHYIFGGPFYREEDKVSKELVIPSNKLEYWENSLRVDSKEIEIDKFYLKRTYPVILREFRHTFKLLSKDWGGTVVLLANTEDGPVEFARKSIAPDKTEWHNKNLERMKGTGISRERLVASLEACIKDGLRRQNNNPNSPTFGALHTFYDFDARLHRTSYWLWGGCHNVKMILDATGVPEIADRFNTKKLVAAAEKIGKLYLKYQVREEGHPSRGSFLVIWTRNNAGYSKWVGTSDSGVMIRWALIPLFQATGDSSYLEASEFWCIEKGRMLDTVNILPHYFKYDDGEFAARILDETGWDPEGHAALYEATGNDLYRSIGKKYMDKHMKIFQQEDGLWRRRHDWITGETQESAKMVRGLGWAMEGLLAMNRMYPDTIYLHYAELMAGQLMDHQLPSGTWSFVFDLDPEEMGITEKGTALWSLLFYQLYEATGDERYLETARRALLWCLDNQYTGPDPEAIGGLVGRTNASMVGMRYYYDATCAYTTGFFGLAILEELKLSVQ